MARWAIYFSLRCVCIEEERRNTYKRNINIYKYIHWLCINMYISIQPISFYIIILYILYYVYKKIIKWCVDVFVYTTPVHAWASRETGRHRRFRHVVGLPPNFIITVWCITTTLWKRSSVGGVPLYTTDAAAGRELMRWSSLLGSRKRQCELFPIVWEAYIGQQRTTTTKQIHIAMYRAAGFFSSSVIFDCDSSQQQ